MHVYTRGCNCGGARAGQLRGLGDAAVAVSESDLEAVKSSMTRAVIVGVTTGVLTWSITRVLNHFFGGK